MKSLTPPQQALFTLFNEIGIISQLSNARFERTLPHGLTIAQFSVLNHLVRLEDDWSPARLAAAFQVTKGTMTSTLQRLVAKDFITLEPNPVDGRAKHVRLTAAGRLAREEALSATAPALGDISAALSHAEIEALIPDLQKLRVWLDKHR